jgi:hypothetical protein
MTPSMSTTPVSPKRLRREVSVVAFREELVLTTPKSAPRIRSPKDIGRAATQTLLLDIKLARRQATVVR